MVDKSTDHENDVTVAQFYCFYCYVDLKGYRLQKVPFTTFFSWNRCIFLTKQRQKDCIHSYLRVAAELAFPPTPTPTPQKSAASIIHRGGLSGKSDTFRKEKPAERIWAGEQMENCSNVFPIGGSSIVLMSACASSKFTSWWCQRK